jgi:uncharacterized protein
MWRSLVSAPALGAGGPGFKSRHPDQTSRSLAYCERVAVTQQCLRPGSGARIPARLRRRGVKTRGMEFFCYHRDRPGSAELRSELLEQHWSYMDRYATAMIARGPTLAEGAASGSVHIVDLPDPAAACAFVFDEPNYQAGVYRDVLLRRWHNTLGRTMWDFPGGRAGGNRYLVLGLGAGQAADLTVRPGREELIAYGPLLSDDCATWLGTAVLVQAPDPDVARAILTPDRYASVEVHDWAFGGRPS